jgi:hypothetical protein
MLEFGSGSELHEQHMGLLACQGACGVCFVYTSSTVFVAMR